jgi:hypothetical protein
MRPPGWLVGISVSVATLDLVAFNSRLLALGIVGLLIVPAIARWAGVAAASIVDPRHMSRNTAAVVCAVVTVFLGYLAIIQSRPLPPGYSQGGANVYPGQGGANVYPGQSGASKSGANESFPP